ncbi:hypothetical protein [Pedobacter frigoris]|uniref:hypothetical protein n=1 Tax=Pedobacter frigoris TaxID=2571272 RepID=UPI00292E0FD7|nr:hypothetical protein [Pedobacter frigoris]
MELRIRHYSKNKWPLHGVLIRGNSIGSWLHELSVMGIALGDADAYIVPAESGYSIAACLILTKSKVPDIGKNEYLQVVDELLVIPERADIFPTLLHDELQQLLVSSKCLLYPGIGLVPLIETINWAAYIQVPQMINHRIQLPVPGIMVPRRIKSFQVFSLAPEEALEQLELSFPKREGENLNPLNLLEKLRLQAYRLLLKNSGPADQISGVNADSDLIKKIRRDFENLESRNQNQIDRLVNMLKSDPAEALKYAIPLDEAGNSRGESLSGGMDWTKRWLDFSLSRSAHAAGSGSVNIGERFYELQSQYIQTAQALIKQQQFQKAAFVYLKLLKDYNKAAKTLEDAGLYSEAAAIYLNYGSDKIKGAKCYEQGRMYLEAIEIYKELKEHEKIGDLYLLINKPEEAMHYFQKTVEEYTVKHQYIKASIICKNKMQDMESGQALLLEGWRADRDAFNCLNNYFNNVGELSQRQREISRIYKNEVEPGDQELFLKVIQHEFGKQNELSGFIRDLAYRIIAERIPKNPEIVSELIKFNKKDQELIKDIIRFNAG